MIGKPEFKGGIMMRIEWTPDLAVGSGVIDAQHQELYRRINQLFEACSQGKGKETVGSTLQFLSDYVVTHFGNEEGYMVKHGYPEYARHKKLHAQFINSLQQLQDEFNREGAGVALVIKTNQVVVEWLNNHIRRVDTKLGAFLAGRS
jgi:hemerythrin